MWITQTFKRIENKGKMVFTVSCIHTVYILSEFNSEKSSENGTLNYHRNQIMFFLAIMSLLIAICKSQRSLLILFWSILCRPWTCWVEKTTQCWVQQTVSFETTLLAEHHQACPWRCLYKIVNCFKEKNRLRVGR